MRAKYIVVSNSSLFEAGAHGIASAQPWGGLAPVASVSEREGLEWPFDSPKSGDGGWGKNRPVIRHPIGLGKAQCLSGLPGVCRP